MKAFVLPGVLGAAFIAVHHDPGVRIHPFHGVDCPLDRNLLLRIVFGGEGMMCGKRGYS